MILWSVMITLALLMLPACAARNANVQKGVPHLPFPEIRKITFVGHQTFSARALRKAMASQQRPFFPPWKRGGDYNRATLDEDLLRLRKYYFERGFLQTQTRVEDVDEDKENNSVQIVIGIEEGPPTLVKDVILAGIPIADMGTESTPEQVLADLALRPGRRLTKADFDRSQSQLLQLMQNAGYARAQLTPQTHVDFDKHEATVTFALEPGELTRFGTFTITGHEQVKESAIRRQILLQEGDPYSEKDLDDTKADIFKMGAFRAVTPRRLNLEDDADAPLNIEFNIRERKPRTLEIGPGASSVERFRLSAKWLHRNLFGGAERLAVGGKISSIVQKVEMSLNFPYFLAPRTSFMQTFFADNFATINTDPLGLLDALFEFEDPYPGYDWLNVGGISRVEHRLSRKLSAMGGLEISFSHFYNVKSDIDPDINTEDNLLFTQFAGLRWDLRDDVLNPTKGVFLDGRVDHSNTALLSEVNFVKLLFEARYFRRIAWRLIVATRFLIGGIQPYGESDDVPQNVRFFAGGPGSVRGYALNRLGPLDDDGDPIGGNSLIEGSVEFRYPLTQSLQGAVFVDFGNVFEDSFSYSLNDLRYAVGAGIRYLTPIGPIRVDYGIIVDRREGENVGRLEFSIGQAF